MDKHVESSEVPPVSDEVVLSTEEHEQLQQRAQAADERQEQLLRLAAEFDNAKKRMEREKQDYAKWATESLVLALLPIIDSFDAALQNLKDRDVKDPVVTGVRLINQQLHELLKREGVERLEALGQPFDAERHEVIQQVETDEQPEQTVVEEIQAGYMLRGRLIRPAMVKISTARTTNSDEGGTHNE